MSVGQKNGIDLSDEDLIRKIHEDSFVACLGESIEYNKLLPSREEIEDYTPRIFRLIHGKKINAGMTDEQICRVVLSSGLIGFLIQMFVRTIAREALLWLIDRIRFHVWK